ncbi:MAG: AMP-binding protein [Bdellovibrionia bacterium]
MAQLIVCNFSENQILLNPLLPSTESLELTQLAEDILSQHSLKHHVVLATSGSTQLPGSSSKLVFLSQEALLTSAAAVNEHLQVSQQDLWYNTLPAFHVGGLGIWLRAYLLGNKVISPMEGANYKWSSHQFVEDITSTRATLTSLVPTQVYDLLQAGLMAPRSLRAVLVGGGRLEVSLYEKARSLGWPLLPSYGMTECCSQIATATLASLGEQSFPEMKILNHVSFEIEDEKVFLRSKSLLTGYGQVLNGVKKFWDPKDQKKRFELEDSVQISQGHLSVLGRKGDFVKISGESLNLSYLREKLSESLLVLGENAQEYHLMAQEDERSGAIIILVTTNKNELRAKQIADNYKSRVLPVAKIREIYYVDEIPRSALGKVLEKKIKLGD